MRSKPQRKHIRGKNGNASTYVLINACAVDNVPVINLALPSDFMISDCNHSSKFLGVSKPITRILASGNMLEEYKPLDCGRFARGKTFIDRISNHSWG